MEKFILRWLINAVALYAAVATIPGIHPQSTGWLSYIWLALIFGLLNALLRPLLKFLTCPLIILTLGVFTLLINTFLFWLAGVSDEYLARIYEAATCLVTASVGEGFGLPLIEAAQHNTPIIARDLPVFKEVAGDAATYFSGDAQALATVVKQWLKADRAGKTPEVSAMPWLTWEQSAEQLKRVVFDNNWMPTPGKASSDGSAE